MADSKRMRQSIRICIDRPIHGVVEGPLGHRDGDGSLEVSAGGELDGREAAVDAGPLPRAEDAGRTGHDLGPQQLAEGLGAVLWICSLDWKELFYVSPALEKLWGLPDEILYQNPLAWLDTLVEEDRAMALTLIAQRKAGDTSQPKRA